MEGSQSQMCHKVTIPSIEILAQMWFAYPIHETLTTQRGKPILEETRLDKIFLNMETLLTKLKYYELPTEHSQRYTNVFSHVTGRMWS